MAQRGSYAKGIAKREEILRAALEVVARNGFRATSVKELADAVGLTQAGLLHYFDSKEGLFTAILRARDEADSARWAELDDIVDLLLAVIRHNSETPGLVQLFASLSTAATSDPGHAARDYFVERYARLRVDFTTAIERRQVDGQIAPDVDAVTLAGVLVAVSDGMQLQWMLDPRTDMAEHVRLVWELALRTATVAAPA
ncbi:TetR family transcriptional regulator [Frigoribacterium sp. Leaf164]|uniref:TetR/AcrR family transcriptional regulator n=1 Tax=Frigoribacterium sp. Leaf164 TaxID=1736282 RepID=UPI00070098B2|nr:TetR/AcrR family transcriptional regulator [Frigoribacterium sp. Leaf164]KQR46353.1 TetR family transcriptional regulator [Frigoribacterium sp. Leaf164]